MVEHALRADLPACPWSAQWLHRGAQTQLSASPAAAACQYERAPPVPVKKKYRVDENHSLLQTHATRHYSLLQTHATGHYYTATKCTVCVPMYKALKHNVLQRTCYSGIINGWPDMHSVQQVHLAISRYSIPNWERSVERHLILLMVNWMVTFLRKKSVQAAEVFVGEGEVSNARMHMLWQWFMGP